MLVILGLPLIQICHWFFDFTHLNGELYASSLFEGVFTSIDNGQTWTQINNGLSEMNVRSLGTSEMAVYSGQVSGDIYKLNEEEDEWFISSTLEIKSCVGSISSSGSFLHAGTYGNTLYYSVNGGDAWTQSGGIATVEIRALISSNQFVFVGTDMLGIYKSSDYGSTFSLRNNGLNSYWFNDFTICEGNLFAGSGEEGIYISADLGESWSSINSGLESLNISSLASDGENVYAGTIDEGIFITENMGSNWTDIGLSSEYITTIQYNENNNTIFTGTKGNGLFKSSNQGLNWTSASSGLPINSYIRALHIFDDKMLLCTNVGEIFISYNYSNQWINITENLFGTPVLSLHSLDNFIYAGVNAGGAWRCPVPEFGDANLDGEINIIDIVLVVDLILSNEYSEIVDLNEDGNINILDIVALVNIILGN